MDELYFDRIDHSHYRKREEKEENMAGRTKKRF